MRKYFPQITAFLLIIVTVVFFASPVFAQAQVQEKSMSLWNLSLFDWLNYVFAFIANTALAVAAFFVSIAGTLLNVAMFFTTHLDAFINNSPVIYVIWQIIRDIASMLLIFLILYAAIQKILGLEKANFGNLIKNIIIMGILINFSFFFARVMIDVSNIVSLQFYNAIAPQNTASRNCKIDPKNCFTISSVVTDGGISDIFMSNLKVTAWYNSKASGGNVANTPSGSPKWLQILLVGAAGSVVMVIAGLSFLAAAVAAIIRIAVLLLLLAFSPVWIAASAIPQLNDFSKKWWNHFQSQLFFLPIYLAFMYVSIRIVSESGFSSLVSVDPSKGLTNYIELFIGFTIIIFMINLPMGVALSVAGGLNSISTKMYEGMRGGFTGFLGRNTAGKLATRVDKYVANTHIGNSSVGRDLRSVTTGKLASMKYGGQRSFLDMQKLKKEISTKDKEITRRKNLLSFVNSGASFKEISDTMKDMKEGERLALGVDYLKNTAVVSQLKSSEFEAIKKSDDFTEEDKETIAKARIDSLIGALGRSDSKTVKFMVDNMDGKQIMKFADKPETLKVLLDPAFIQHLKPTQLSVMADEGLDASVRKQIGDVVRNNRGFKNYGYISGRNNMKMWS